MSKTKKIIIIVTALVLVLALLGVGLFLIFNNKREEVKIKLETPNIALQIDGNKKILVSNNNLLASGYAFYIYEGDNPEETYDYIRFDTLEEEPNKKFYFDVTDIFDQAKDYYYACQCLGNEDYADSEWSNIEKFSNKLQLDTPQISKITDFQFSWPSVANATKYEIYESNALIGTTLTTFYDVQNYVLSKPQEEFSFYIKALGGDNYLESAISNVSKYQKTYVLPKVVNVQFSLTDKTLTWNNVENVSKYQIVFNGNESEILETTANTYSFAEKITTVGTYSFKVKAIGDEKYKDGEFSEVCSVTKTEKLQKVKNFSYRIIDNSISVEFEPSQNADSYTVKLNGDVIFESLSTNGFLFDITNNQTEFVIEVVANGHGYFQSSSTASYTVIL